MKKKRFTQKWIAQMFEQPPALLPPAAERRVIHILGRPLVPVSPADHERDRLLKEQADAMHRDSAERRANPDSGTGTPSPPDA